MSEVVVVAGFKARPGKEEEARRALSGVVEPTHGESGCVLYALHQGLDDPARFVLVERWSSREEADAHLASPHIAAFLERVDELLVEAPEITAYDAVPAGEREKGRLAGPTA
ncbi:MAG: putative quinol monooxygenase [Nocardioidaceae bacterium]